MEKNIYVIPFENTSQYILSGKDAELKNMFRDKINEILGKELNPKHLLHINDFFYQTIEYSNLYFTPNSIKLLKNISMRNLLNPKLKKCRIFLNTYKNILYNNFTLLEQNNFLVRGSVSYYIYGTRECGDLDLFYCGHPETDEIKEKLIKYFSSLGSRKGKKIEKENNKNYKYFDSQGLYFTDWSSQSFGIWHLDTRSDKFKKRDFYKYLRYHDEWTLDPKYYEYFFGIKVLTLDNIIINHFIKSILDPTLFKRMCKRLTDMYVLYTEGLLNINPELKKLLTKERLLEYQELIDWTRPNNGEIKKTTYDAITHELINKLKNIIFLRKIL